MVVATVLLASRLSIGQAQAPSATGQPAPQIANNPSQTDNGAGEIPTFYSHARQVLVTVGVWKNAAPSAAWVPKDILKRIPMAAEDLATPPVARGLSAKDFHIFDNGAEQKINYLEESDFPWRDVNRQWFFFPRLRGTWGVFFLDPLSIAAPTATYIIGYTPSLTQSDNCHKIRVVSARNDVVLNRDRYCNAEEGETAIPEGKKLAAKMENFAESASPGSIKVSSQPFVFWSSRVLSLMGDKPVGSSSASGSAAANYAYVVVVHDSQAPATVQIATEYDLGRTLWDYPCPSNAAIYIFGVVYNKAREVVTQFGDRYPCLSKSQNNYYRINTGYELEGEPGRQWVTIPSRFNTQVQLRPGDYDVRVVVSDGHKFGQTRIPLRVGPFDRGALTISDLALNGTLRDASWLLRDAGVVSPAPLLPSPLVSKHAQFIPVPDARLSKNSSLPLYFEIYEPLLADRSAEVYLRMKISDLKDGTVVINAGPTNAAEGVTPGNVVIPIALNVDTERLPSGSYKIEVQGSDSAGRTTEWRMAKFEIQ